jgi:hypothetical protein
MRCTGGLVAVGDSKLDLLGKCGKPTLVEDGLEERVAKIRDRDRIAAWKARVTVSIERWTYDFGPNQFVQYVTLDAGRIVAVERGSYGYRAAAVDSTAPAIPRCRCEPNDFHEGDSTFDVLARCGPPATTDAREEKEAVSHGDGEITASRTIVVEVWAYDFGPQVFVRLLTFAGGKIVKIETGGYGYAPGPAPAEAARR